MSLSSFIYKLLGLETVVTKEFVDYCIKAFALNKILQLMTYTSISFKLILFTSSGCRSLIIISLTSSDIGI